MLFNDLIGILWIWAIPGSNGVDYVQNWTRIRFKYFKKKKINYMKTLKDIWVFVWVYNEWPCTLAQGVL